MSKVKVVVRSVRQKSPQSVVQEMFDSLGWHSFVPPHSSVVIKLNLNTADPTKIASANTSPELVKAVCKVLQSRTRNITLVEAHAYRHSADEAFNVCGIYNLAQHIGVRVVNLSEQPTRDVGINTIGQLPEILLDADVFITMPVVKTHALTYFTGSLKNQWGCVPRFDRIALHWALDEMIVELQRTLKPKLCIMDGIIGVEGRGPTNGKPRELGIILGSTDAVALDATAMRFVGLDPQKARHVLLASKAGLGEIDESSIQIDSDIVPDWPPFEPAKLDWAVAWMNRWSKYAWFRHYLLEIDVVFQIGKRLVAVLRNIGVVR